MNLLFHFIAYATVLFTTKRIAALNCPDLLIRIGTSQVISCDRDPDIIDFYWYKGLTSDTSPILTLEDGQKGGSEYGKRHFDIEDDGSMIINDVTLEHESHYTVVGYDEGGNDEIVTFMINVTIPPDPPCPVIEDCNPCTKCVISQPRESGTLKCSISGARPLIHLLWNVTFQTGISFVKYQPVEQRNQASNSWDTSILLGYTLMRSCGVRANINCVAQDNASIVSSPVASLEISNGACADEMSTPGPNDVDMPSRNKLITIIIISVFFTVIVITVLILISLCLWKRKRSDAGRPGNIFDPEEVPLLEKQPVFKVLPSGDSKASFIVGILKKNYEKHCSVQPLPWGEDIPINALYTDCQCTVTTRNGRTCAVTSSELLTGGYIMNEKRVIFIGALGFGKTTFTKQVVNNWIQSSRKYLLLYILLKDVKRDMTLSEIVTRQLTAGGKVTEDDIASIISQYGCLLLLDGLDELSMTMENGSCIEKYVNDSQAEQREIDERSIISLTVEQILKGETEGNDEHMQIWVTSREIDYVNSTFPPPYVRVKMSGFSKEQAEDYINKTCRIYRPPKRIDTGVEPDEKLKDKENLTPFHNARADGNSSVPLITQNDKDNQSETNMEYADKEEAEGGVKSVKLTNKEDLIKERKGVAHKVKQFLESNDVFYSFKATPLLFIMMVHIVAAKYTSAVSHLEALTIDKLTHLIGTVLSCLKSRYGKKRHMDSSEEISFLENKLGEIALRHKLKVKGMDREFWIQEIGEKYVKMALDIGYLQQSTDTAISSEKIRRLAFSSFSGIEFYDELFQAYLAACFVINNSENIHQLMKLVNSAEEYETFRVLQFLCGLDESKVEDVCRRLKKLGKHNNLIDCLYEVNDQEKYKKVLQTIRKDTLHISYLDRSYHMNSFSAFCAKCNELGVQLTSVVFHSGCTICYLRTLNLPEIDVLGFCRVSLDTSEFVSFLKWLPCQRVNDFVSFLECEIPTTISEVYALEEVRNAEQEKVPVYRKKHISDTTRSLFIYSSGTWSWKPLTFSIYRI